MSRCSGPSPPHSPTVPPQPLPADAEHGLAKFSRLEGLLASSPRSNANIEFVGEDEAVCHLSAGEEILLLADRAAVELTPVTTYGQDAVNSFGLKGT